MQGVVYETESRNEKLLKNNTKPKQERCLLLVK